MNSKERVFSVLTGNKPDKNPVSLTLSLFGSKLINCSSEIYYSNYKEYVKGQSAIVENVSPDILFSPFSLSLEGAAFGSEIFFHTNGAPVVKKPTSKNINDIKNLKLPDFNKNKFINFITDSVKLLKELYGNTHPIAGIVSSPVDLPIMLTGIENWLEILLFDEKKAKEIIDITSEFFINYSNNLISNGADFIVIPATFCNPKIITKEIIENFVIQKLNKIFPKIKAPIVIHHGGNKIDSFIESYIKLKNVIGFVISPHDNFSEIRKIIGNDYLLMGNIEGPNIINMSESVIEKLCFNIKENTKNDPKFIFSTSGADICYETDINKLILIKNLMSKQELI